MNKKGLIGDAIDWPVVTIGVIFTLLMMILVVQASYQKKASTAALEEDSSADIFFILDSRVEYGLGSISVKELLFKGLDYYIGTNKDFNRPENIHWAWEKDRNRDCFIDTNSPIEGSRGGGDAGICGDNGAYRKIPLESFYPERLGSQMYFDNYATYEALLFRKTQEILESNYAYYEFKFPQAVIANSPTFGVKPEWSSVVLSYRGKEVVIKFRKVYLENV